MVFRMTGQQLCQLSQQQFCQLAQVKQSGDVLYSCLEKLRSSKGIECCWSAGGYYGDVGTVMGGVEFRPMYDDNFLPSMVDSMIDGLPSFPPSFDDHPG